MVLLTPFNKIPGFSIDLTNFMISSSSSFEISNVVISDPKVFFYIPAFIADAVAINPIDISTFSLVVYSQVLNRRGVYLMGNGRNFSKI